MSALGIDASGLLPAWDGRAVLLVDLDAFFASVEQLDHPAWRGHPVIVGGDPDKHGVVSTASYEARTFGVRSAMPSSMARRLCPDAIWTEGHFNRYRQMSSQVMSILLDESPMLEQVSIDEAFLDVSPTAINVEHPVGIAQRIQQRVAGLGVTCSIGVGTSKTIAKIASDIDKPNGMTVVWPGSERDFLSPLPVRSMSGIGKRAEEVLRRYGISTLGQLAVAEESVLASVFGKNSSMMRNRCLGADASPVGGDDSIKSVSNEVTLAEDVRSRSQMLPIIDTMAAKVARRLRRKNLAGITVALKLRFADRTSRSAQQRMAHPVDNEREFIPVLHALLDQIWHEGIPVRLAGVAVSGFGEGPDAQQSMMLDLFSDAASESLSSEKSDSLARATDGIKDRFGEGSLIFGRELSLMDMTTGTGAKNPADYK